MQAALSTRATFVAGRRVAARPSRVQQRVCAQYSPEQQAFLDRKRQSGGSVAPAAPARGRSATPAQGLSAEQQAFLARKAQESRSASPAAVPSRGRSASARPSSRTPTPAARPTSAPTSYNPPAAASANGLSAEQQEFLARKAQESRSASPAAPARGRSASARPASGAAATSGLSAEQQAFLARKRSESPAAPAARGRSASSRPSARTPALVSNSSVRSAMSTPTTAGLSAEQQAFLARKVQESRSASPAAPARGHSATAGATAGLSAEQQAFLARKASGQR
ncbi:hypothetical protein C2E20_7991 [Micractinium conductrix]|nr:hypothetical protein C2E20_7991 [Micractinium conductrix]|eukprot:PSC68468.1 hypothetical protein C2E20_7991 [Micractinium conductrix]